MNGRGITVCAFCHSQIEFVVEDDRISTHGKEPGVVVVHGRGEARTMTFYCSQACERAADSHLFDSVLK